MTPSERAAAERVLGQCVRSACSGAYAREVSSYLRQTLKQIDADERLMRKVLPALTDSMSAWECGCPMAYEKIAYALRARLGQEQEGEKP